jgi:phage tail sheath protein FI
LAKGDLPGDPDLKTGIYALDGADLFNLLVIPPDSQNGDVSPTVYGAALDYCVTRRAMLIVDSPSGWSSNPVTAANDALKGFQSADFQPLHGSGNRNGALFFLRVRKADPLSGGQVNTYPASGIIAGVMARTDVSRGVWKAPAGIDAQLNGTVGLDVTLTNEENGRLNPFGINCLRTFPTFGTVVWGSRTLAGADQLADDYKYVPVRRLALFLEESLYRGTQWVVFEPNDEPLWSQIRLNVGAFMHNLFVKGAFQGQTPADAYFVKCDKNTNPQNTIDLGIVNIVVGFAPLKPAEFVIIQIQQIAGSIAT